MENKDISVGDIVYYMLNNKIHQSIVLNILRKDDMKSWDITDSNPCLNYYSIINGIDIVQKKENEIFKNKKDLIKSLDS